MQTIQNTVVVVRDSAALDQMLDVVDANPGPIGFDTEAHGREIRGRSSTWLDWYSAELTGYSVSVANDNWYVPVRHTEGGNCPLQPAKRFLNWLAAQVDFGRTVWCHNLKVELQLFANEGLTVGRSEGGWSCSQVAAWLAGWGADHKSLKLKKLAERLGYGAGDTFAELAGKRRACDIPVDELAPYAGRDAWLTKEVGERAYARLREVDLARHFHEIDMPLVEIIRGIEAWGTPVDADRVRTQRERLQTEADAFAERFEFLTTTTVQIPTTEKRPTGEFYKNGKPKLGKVEVLHPVEMGAKINNDRQVSMFCYNYLGVWPTEGLKVNGNGVYPVDKETLDKFTTLPGLGGELARLRLDWAWRDKLCGTYLKPLLELPPQYADGLLHTSLHLTGTETQRFSSSNPNLQNIPSRTEEGRAIRKALRARPGWVFVIFDYSQIELRLLAHLSRDPELLACYALDIDVHQGTLEEMLKLWKGAQRVHAKTTNFSTAYRISADALAVKMKCSVEEAQKSIDAFYARFAWVRDYHEAAIEYAATHGYARTIDGFKRFLDTSPRYDFRTKTKRMPWGVENAAINTPIQGSGAGLAKLAMIALWRRWRASGDYGVRVHLAGQEHDAIIAEAREDFADAAYAHMKFDMESALTLRVPIVAEGGKGPSWGEAKH